MWMERINVDGKFEKEQKFVRYNAPTIIRRTSGDGKVLEKVGQ